MGTSYQNAVLACLESKYNDQTRRHDFSTMFDTKVARKLSVKQIDESVQKACFAQSDFTRCKNSLLNRLDVSPPMKYAVFSGTRCDEFHVVQRAFFPVHVPQS